MNQRDKSCIPPLKKEQFTFDIGTLNSIGGKEPETKKLWEVLERMPKRAGRQFSQFSQFHGDVGQ